MSNEWRGGYRHDHEGKQRPPGEVLLPSLPTTGVRHLTDIDIDVHEKENDFAPLLKKCT